MDGLISEFRKEFHATLLAGILTVGEQGTPSNADRSSKTSVAIAKSIVEQLGDVRTSAKLPGQTAGSDFEQVCADYIKAHIKHLQHLRPGDYFVTKGGGIAEFDQYSHLDQLQAISRANRDLATALGSDYLIKPDIVMGRMPYPDEVLNENENLVDESSAQFTSLRKINQPLPILHASLSCKWTVRSDRAQNARSEGLNLVRNRKGRLPHIAVITGEPMPARIASLALGTGDIDCVYHFALYELRNALVDQEREDTLELLETMIEGKRLRDISDLPLDLVT